MRNNKWLKRIFTLEFAAFCVAIIAVYFAYIPIKNYFFQDNSIVAIINDKQIKLSDNKEGADTIPIIVYLYEYKSIPTTNLLIFKNTSNHILKGVNVKAEYECNNLMGISSPEWKYRERKAAGMMTYSNNELAPYGEIVFPFENVSQINFDELTHELFISITLSYEGSHNEKYISTVLSLAKIESGDLFYNNESKLTTEEKRIKFNDNFIKRCIDLTYNEYKRSKHKDVMKKMYFYIMTLDGPVIMSMKEIIDRKKSEQRISY